MKGASINQATGAAAEPTELNTLRISKDLEKTQSAPAVEPKSKPEAVVRFEQVLSAELSGTSFSKPLERQRSFGNKQQIATQKSFSKIQSSNAPKEGMPRFFERINPFKGATLLDKVVSFAAYILKFLEKLIFGLLLGRRGPAPKPNQNMRQDKESLQRSTQPQKKSKQQSGWRMGI